MIHLEPFFRSLFLELGTLSARGAWLFPDSPHVFVSFFPVMAVVSAPPLRGFPDGSRVCSSRFLPARSFLLPGARFKLLSITRVSWCGTVFVFLSTKPSFLFPPV